MKFAGDQILAENFDGVGLVRDVVHKLDCPPAARRGVRYGPSCPRSRTKPESVTTWRDC
jgi:hypothetical protein